MTDVNTPVNLTGEELFALYLLEFDNKRAIYCKEGHEVALDWLTRFDLRTFPRVLLPPYLVDFWALYIDHFRIGAHEIGNLTSDQEEELQRRCCEFRSNR